MGLEETGRERNDALDVLRGLAIAMMIVVHGLRGLLGGGWRGRVPAPGMSGLDAAMVRIWWWTYTTTPFISTLFLTLVGVSLVLSRRAAGDPGAWRRRQLLRGLGLVALDLAIFMVERGIHGPWPFLSSGILHTIGLGVILGIWIAGPGPGQAWGIAAWIGGMAGMTAVAEAHPDHPLGLLAQGPGAHLPNLIFVGLGVALARWMLDVPPGWRRIIPAAGAATLLVYHVAVLPAVQAEIPGRPCTVEVAFNEPWGRSMVHRSWDVGPGLGSVHQLRQLAAAVDPGREAPRPGLVDHPFWNKRLRQVPWLAGIMLTLLGLAWTRPAGAVVRKAAVLLRPLRVCGRVALRIYVFHLVVLAAVVTAAGRARHGPWPTLAVTAGVFLGCWGFAELSRVRRGTKFFPARKQVSP